MILSLVTSGLLMMASCQNNADKWASGADTTLTAADTMMADHEVSANEIKPIGPAPAWAPGIKAQMLAVIEKLGSYRDKPIQEL